MEGNEDSIFSISPTAIFASLKTKKNLFLSLSLSLFLFL
jgi:hypothetical protein